MDEDSEDGRSTAPQSDYGAPEVQIGLAVALVGLAVAFGIPLALTL